MAVETQNEDRERGQMPFVLPGRTRKMVRSLPGIETLLVGGFQVGRMGFFICCYAN